MESDLLLGSVLFVGTPLMISTHHFNSDDGKDHVLYAVMAADDSGSGLLAICAFSLLMVDAALNKAAVVLESSNAPLWKHPTSMNNRSTGFPPDSNPLTATDTGTDTARTAGVSQMTVGIAEAAKVNATLTFGKILQMHLQSYRSGYSIKNNDY